MCLTTTSITIEVVSPEGADATGVGSAGAGATGSGFGAGLDSITGASMLSISRGTAYSSP